MPRQIITLTTDFGLRDPYVAEMKAAILGICRNLTIVDITHEIEKFNIRMGAHVLASAYPYFPEGTVHVAVVDPSVGTKRRPIIMKTKHCYLVGPDNGVLALAAKKQGVEHVYEISNRKLMLPKISNTFHGRDVFAPAAAYLAIGTPPEQFGLEVFRIVTPEFAKVVRRKDMVSGEVLYVDSFGNVITNFGEKELELIGVKVAIDVKLKNTRLKLKLCKAYAEAKPQEALAIIGSHNFLEISINQGNAAGRFQVRSGNKIAIYR